MPPSIVLIQPRIPQNVGAIARLCAASGSTLYVVRPIPFELNDRSLQRAGMDYLHLLTWQDFNNWQEFKSATPGVGRWFLSSHATRSLYDAPFEASDALVFGNESAGLPGEIRDEMQNHALRIPMPVAEARCLNLATSVAISLYELLRKTGQVS